MGKHRRGQGKGGKGAAGGDAASAAAARSAADGGDPGSRQAEREEKRRRKEAAKAEKESRKQAEREAKQRRKEAAREEKRRAREAERAEKERRKEARRQAGRVAETGDGAGIGSPRASVVAEEMAQATAAVEQSLGAEPGLPAGEAVRSSSVARKRGIPASALERRDSSAGAHGSSEVEVRARRGRHEHVDLFDAFESIHWREFKILLKPEDFSDDVANDVSDYWRLARRVAGQLDLAIRRNREESKPRLREIVFLDTPGSDFYRNSFMLRVRREILADGPAKEYELTLKFRDPDVGRALGVDPRPAPGVSGVMKFKEEILLVSSALGGMRSIFSHTCQLKAHRGPLPATFADCLAIFPMLACLKLAPETPIAPAVDTRVEEVLYDLGEICFRGSKTAKVDMAIWRNAETGKILIGEFAYETHFRHYGRLNPVPKLRSERLYRLLQRETGAWVELGNTKTWIYYGLSGRKVHDE